MEQFSIFGGQSSDPLALEVNTLIASVLETDSLGNRDYFSEFNKDAMILNQLLDNPPSSKVTAEKVEQARKIHNQVLALSKERLEKSGKNVSIAINAKDSWKQARDHYQEACAQDKWFEARKRKINEYLSEKKWADLLANIKKPEKLKLVQELKLDWTAQQRFAHYNSEDLVFILEELEKFEWFLKLIDSGDIQKKSAGILKGLKENKQCLERLYAQITIAMAWRVYAADLKGDLWFDDALWALSERLNKGAGEQKDLSDILINHSLPGTLRSSMIKNFRIVRKRIQTAPNGIDRDKFYHSRWIQDRQNRYPIKVSVTKDLEIIPQELAPLVPTEHGFFSDIFPDNFIRYFYFRGYTPNNKLEKWLKNLFIGEPYELILFLNEADFQVHQLSQVVIKDKKINLSEITKISGFKNALLLPELLAQEKARMDRLQPHFWWTRLWYYLARVFFKNKTQDFFAKWKRVLSDIEKNSLERTGRIATKIVSSLESSLIQEINTNIFNFPKDLIRDLFEFVQHYGSEQEKERFSKITSPEYLFSQFQFGEKSGSGLSRQINKDAVEAFLRYAKLYWNEASCEAAQRVAGLLLETGYPQNEAEDKQLLQSLSSWFSNEGDIEKQNQEGKSFLNKLGVDFVAKIGSRSNRLAYRFLKQFSPCGLKIWEEDREKVLNSKYVEFVSVLSKPSGSETDSYVPEYIEDLKRDQSNHNYIGVLLGLLQNYLNNYDGSNGKYAELVYHLDDPADAKCTYLEPYLKKRVEYLLAHPNEVALRSHEASIYYEIGKNKIIIEYLRKMIAQNYTGENRNLTLCEMVVCLNDRELDGHYGFVRLVYLIKHKKWKTIYDERLLADKTNAHFKNKVDVFLETYIKTVSFNTFDPALGWVLEYYGNQEIRDACLFGSRVAWLNGYLFKSDLPDEKCLNMLDASNNSPNLTVFFGSQMSAVKKMLNHYLDTFEYGFVQKLKLIERYLADDFFKTDKEWAVWDTKLSVYQTMHEIIYHIRRQEWAETKQCLEGLTQAADACRFLLVNTKEKEQVQAKVQHYEKMLCNLKEIIIVYTETQKKQNVSTSELEGIIGLFERAGTVNFRAAPRAL